MVLVTGASGFVGRALVAALVADGAQVRALSRSTSTSPWNDERVTVVRADLLEAGVIRSALEGVGAVVHLAAALDGPPDVLRQVNVDATIALARGARLAQVPLIVHCSSAGVYGDGATWAAHTEATPPAPQTPYERSKLDGEVALRAALGDAVPWIVLRPSGVHGAGRPATLALYRRVARRRIWPHGPTVQLVHPTDVQDVVSAIRAALDRPNLAGRVFNVGGERALPYPDLLALVASHLGTHLLQPRFPTLLHDAARAFVAAGVELAPMRRLARVIVNRSVDISAARDALALRPVPLEEAIARTAAAFRQQGVL